MKKYGMVEENSDYGDTKWNHGFESVDGFFCGNLIILLNETKLKGISTCSIKLSENSDYGAPKCVLSLIMYKYFFSMYLSYR